MENEDVGEKRCLALVAIATAGLVSPTNWHRRATGVMPLA